MVPLLKCLTSYWFTSLNLGIEIFFDYLFLQFIWVRGGLSRDKALCEGHSSPLRRYQTYTAKFMIIQLFVTVVDWLSGPRRSC